MQALEGPDESVAHLYRTIERDPRHHAVLELIRQQIGARGFAAWSMGFRNLKDVTVEQTPGYSAFLNQPLHATEFQVDPSRAQKLLRMFRDQM